MLRRRVLVASLAAALITPLVATAQRAPEVGILIFGTESRSINVREGLHPLREALRDLGWIDGRNVVLKPRFADLDDARLAALARELVREKVDVIVAIGTPPTAAARLATTSIPIVMSASGDPVAAGFVRDLARPEANVTGTSLIFTETAAKRLELLKEW